MVVNLYHDNRIAGVGRGCTGSLVHRKGNRVRKDLEFGTG